MHDIATSGGTILDRGRSPGLADDVAIEGGRLALAGGKAGPARRGIGASGQGQGAGGCLGPFVRAGR